MTKIEQHEELCNRIHCTYVAKNNEYGDIFGKCVQELGPIAGIVRLEDEMARIKGLVKGEEDKAVRGETMQESLLALADYAIMLYMELENESDREDFYRQLKYTIRGEWAKCLTEARWPRIVSDVYFEWGNEGSAVYWRENGEDHMDHFFSLKALAKMSSYERGEYYKSLVLKHDTCEKR